MAWAEANTPEEVFGFRNKPYHLTGRLKNYSHYLHATELIDIDSIINILLLAAENESIIINALLAGTAAASDVHGDVDMLVSTYPSSQRIAVAHRSIELFQQNLFKVEVNKPQRNVDSLSDQYLLRTKVFVQTMAHINTFDISFNAVNGGSWEDVLNFHQRAGLAHSIIK